jgi:hypothetical protein
MPREPFRMKLPVVGTTPTETAMATLTGRRTQRRRNHLRLVTGDERTRRTLPVDDPTPGPRDAAALVEHFGALLPNDVETEGVFSLGAE